MIPHNKSGATRSRYAKFGLTALTTVSMFAGAGSTAHADVVVTNANLTTPGSGNIFFNFATQQASSTTFDGYQYQLASGTNAASLTGTSSTTITNSFLTDCNSGNVLRLASGSLIDNSSQFPQGSNFFANTTSTISSEAATNDYWLPGNQGYIGFRMSGNASGTTVSNFGWADITLGNNYEITLNRFAYETTPNQAIAAGSTVSIVPEANPLELLLIGAAGLGAYRLLQKKRETAEVTA